MGLFLLGYRRNKISLAELDWFPAIWFGGSLFGLSILLAGYLRAGYSHVHQSISELGTTGTPYSWLVRWVGFMSLGSSFVLFAHQTRDLFSSYAPSVIFLLTGLAVLISGIFPSDPNNRRDTLSGKGHALAVITLLFLLNLAPFTFSISTLYRTPPAEWFSVFSLLMGILTLGFLGILPNFDSPLILALHRRILGRLIVNWYPLHGLHQRLLLAMHFLWWLVFSRILTLLPENLLTLTTHLHIECGTAW